MVTLVVGVLLLVTAPVAAQDVASAARGIPPGSLVRVRDRSGIRIEGRLARITATEIRLDDAAAPGLALADLDSLWVAGRETRRGAITGAKIGGIGGAVVRGVLTARVVEGRCETGDCNGAAAGLVGALVGGAGGAASGAVVGGAVGSALTRWRLVFPSADGARAPAPLEPYGLARATLTYGRAGDASGSDGAMGLSAAIQARYGPWLTVGPEVALYRLGARNFPAHYRFPSGQQALSGNTFPYSYTGRAEVFTAGAVVRVMPPRGTLRPYLVGGIGLHNQREHFDAVVACTGCSPWDGDPRTVGGTYPVQFAPWVNETARLGSSVGAGIDLALPHSPLHAGLEGRWHGRPAFLTVSLVAGANW